MKAKLMGLTRALPGLTIAAMCATTASAAAPDFYLGDPCPSCDLPWRLAVDSEAQLDSSALITELDLDGITNQASIDLLSAGDITIDVGLAGIDDYGNPATREMAESFWSGGFHYPGMVEFGALLNRGPDNVVLSQVTLEFSAPVTGVGLYIFDDDFSSSESFRMIATDGAGQVWTSGVLESGNGNSHAVEGFIGVVSEVGIASIAIECLDTNTLEPTARYFELDHIQIGPISDGYGLTPTPTGGIQILAGANVSIPNHDTDGDGVDDNADLFPTDPNETGDEDGDGVGDNADPCTGYPNNDTDGDTVCDDSDVCPTDALDLDEDDDGVCDVAEICIGTLQAPAASSGTLVDADGDTIPDCLDDCPGFDEIVDDLNQDGVVNVLDYLLVADDDGDHVCNDIDLCEGNDASGDEDGDGLCDSNDNCPSDANGDQLDADADGVGDACEADTDGDGVNDDDDNCVADSNADQGDIDLDGAGDVCDDDDDNDGVTDSIDNCPFYDNADQVDYDGDGYGDACDGDDDADGVDDGSDSCPGTPLSAVFDANGCSGEQRIELVCGEPADYSWGKHRYVGCVVKESRSTWRQGLITGWQRARLIRQAVPDVSSSYIRRIRRWR